MKKLISILLVICMLAAATAFAATEKVGVTMAAQEGLDFTLMENRHTLDDEDVRNRMQWAYQTIHDTDHFSEMESVNHENGIAQDINQELVEMGADLTAYDYLIYDSFELQLQDAYADQLGNGNTLEVNFDLNLDREVKLVVLLSNNEESWQCLDHENVNQNADGTAAVRFSELGTVLFLIDVKHQPASAGAEPDSNFTPSVSGKPAPDVVPPSGADPDIIARIYNENDELISEVPDEGWLVITPVSRRDTAEDKEVRERLEWAYNQIQTTPRLGDLPSETAGEGVGAQIDSVLDRTGFADLTSDDLIVRDLFDASLYGDEYVDALNDDGHYIEITFDLGVDPDDPLVILITNDNKTWQVLDPSCYVINPDGSVTMQLEELGAIAILVDAEDLVVDENTSVKSPKTGED